MRLQEAQVAMDTAREVEFGSGDGTVRGRILEIKNGGRDAILQGGSPTTFLTSVTSLRLASQNPSE